MPSNAALAKPKTCPKPEKRAFKSRKEAYAAALRWSRRLGPMRVYGCECGSLHLTRRR